jgi:hypothetical protein
MDRHRFDARSDSYRDQIGFGSGSTSKRSATLENNFKSTRAFLCSKDILSQKSEVVLIISWGHFAGHPSAVETKKDARMVVCAMPRQGRIYFRKPVSKGKM